MKEFFNKHKSNIIFLLILVGIVIRRCDFEWKQDLEDHFTIPSHSFSRQIYEKDGTLKDMKYITDLFLTYTKDTAWSDLPEFEEISKTGVDKPVYRSIIRNKNAYKYILFYIDIDTIPTFVTSLSTPISSVILIEKEYTNIYPALDIFEKAFPEDKEDLREISNALPQQVKKYIDNLSMTNEQDFVQKGNKYGVSIFNNLENNIPYHHIVVSKLK